MSKTHQHLSETHILGPRTRQYGLRVGKSDSREWLSGFPVCPMLAQHQIAHVGICAARAPYRIVRAKQSGTYFLACFGGGGRILVDGRWQICRAGTAVLLPTHMLNAFYADAGAPWEFCWVRYQQPAEQKPIHTSSSPVLARFDPAPLRAAIDGLYHESHVSAAPGALHHWVELIQLYVLRFARPLQLDDRLWRLWERVSNHLGEEWTLEKLAGCAHLSAEHLRRLTRHQLGRSPMHQVIYLRMRHAAGLLASTDQKIETIANTVGYQNPFVFSTTFKKWIGWRPSEHRQQSRAERPR